MSITLLICLLVPKGIFTMKFAPGFGNGLFDPLLPISDSSDSYLENDMDIIPIKRQRNEPIKISTKNNADYEECIEISSRILCGYGKNKGLNPIDQVINLSNGCRIRGDRLECGYDNKSKLSGVIEKSAQRQRPTRTPMSGTSNKGPKIDSDILENKLLKSTFDKLSVKSLARQNVTKPTVLIEPTGSV
ncbi:uncharacterized protein LOC111361869 isoform X2 [Spodoptera litura]|uniref:Uncharacterized protein LOC111361869 isoform X2 n=1 Tax=Spodoptera litura TaxID=69820 RepID=A0A9J7EM58_SPOLT|nr:uncharacterized protein LOC111361869 isoform X2 [Spodoptera litura]